MNANWTVLDADLVGLEQLSERLESIGRNREVLLNREPSNYPDVNAKRDAQVARLTEREGTLWARRAAGLKGGR